MVCGRPPLYGANVVSSSDAATLRLAAVFKDDDGRVKFECAAVSRIDWRRRRRDESLTKLADARCPSVSQDSCCKV